MWPFRRNPKGKFEWPNGLGYKPCICSCGHPLDQEEIKMTWWSQSGGDLRSFGTAKCSNCHRSMKWDSRENYG